MRHENFLKTFPLLRKICQMYGRYTFNSKNENFQQKQFRFLTHFFVKKQFRYAFRLFQSGSACLSGHTLDFKYDYLILMTFKICFMRTTRPTISLMIRCVILHRRMTMFNKKKTWLTSLAVGFRVFYIQVKCEVIERNFTGCE